MGENIGIKSIVIGVILICAYLLWKRRGTPISNAPVISQGANTANIPVRTCLIDAVMPPGIEPSKNCAIPLAADYLPGSPTLPGGGGPGPACVPNYAPPISKYNWQPPPSQPANQLPQTTQNCNHPISFSPPIQDHPACNIYLCNARPVVKTSPAIPPELVPMCDNTINPLPCNDIIVAQPISCAVIPQETGCEAIPIGPSGSTYGACGPSCNPALPTCESTAGSSGGGGGACIGFGSVPTYCWYYGTYGCAPV